MRDARLPNLTWVCRGKKGQMAGDGRAKKGTLGKNIRESGGADFFGGGDRQLSRVGGFCLVGRGNLQYDGTRA